MNVVITWASGEAFCRSEVFAVYIESLKVFDREFTDIVVFTHDMPQDTRQNFKNETSKSKT